MSLESLGRIWMPTITTIDLNRNHVSNLSILKKVNWPHLEEIVLVDNWVKEGRFFVFLQSKVESLDFGGGGPHQVEDMKWIGKMMSVELRGKGLSHQKRIKWGKLEKALRRKYRYI